MKLEDIICFDAVVPKLASVDRDGVINELVSALGKSGSIRKNKVAEIAQAVITRESEASTGIGKGVAVPHVKTDLVKKIVATIGCCSAGIDFSSLDKQPTYSVLLLLSPANDPDCHLQAMETIFKYLQKDDFRKFLRQSDTSESIHDLITDFSDE
ncbi:MAG: PTS sugar transporter subunit IIA [Anaerohalosphaera sp.]|nr:PTS sugar transporter subunit IIA [Anaerohalosphaera sp.]